MKSEIIGISERLKKTQIGLKDVLAVIDMTLEDQPRELASLFPYDVFEGLDDLINRTLHGTKIELFKPKENGHPFHTFEIHTEEGEVLGYLNMVYLRQPIPSYYLVYVEVLPPFRGRGLGNRILKAFKEFAEEQGAVGLLDNIILPEEPTYDIYIKNGWKCIEELIGEEVVNGEGHYMVFIPTSMTPSDLRDRLIKLLLKVRGEKPIIDMHDNEAMVNRTIMEFRSIYETLEHLFEMEISTGTSTPFMRFVFTKFVTRVLGFQRRIASLIGYTGGESLEQISISDQVKNLSIQPYSLWWAKEGKPEIWGEEEILRDLPEKLKKDCTLYIECLPLYRRPYLTAWIEERGRPSHNLKIFDLLELGFDPTKLRGFRQKGIEYIFERITPRFISSIEKKRRFLPKILEYSSSRRFRDATVQINSPIAILQEKGNVYILRKRVDGIHSEEAMDQLRTASHLKSMNRSVRIDHAVILTINEIKKWLMKEFAPGLREEIEDLAFFIPWDLGRNMPRVTVDTRGVSLDTLWIA